MPVRRRARTANVLESDFRQAVAVDHFFSGVAELETVGIERMENQKQRRKSVAHQHRPVLLVGLGFMHRYPRLGQAQLPTVIAQDYEIVVARFFFEIDFLASVIPEFLLGYLFGAAHIGKPLDILGHDFAGAL